jgi:hypothetical protein
VRCHDHWTRLAALRRRWAIALSGSVPYRWVAAQALPRQTGSVSIAAVRIQRSAERLEAFAAAIATWNADETIKLALDMSPDRQRWRLFVDEVRTTPPTESWVAVLGEVVHHVRSGLNNVVFAVAAQQSRGSPARPRSIQFPIAAVETAFDRSVRDQLGEAHDELLDIVRAFQPFGSGQDFLQPGPGLLGQHPFSLLAEFSNSDKHTEWLAMPHTATLAELGDAGGPVSIRFDREVDDDDFGQIELVADPIVVGATLLRQECKVPIRELRLRGRVRITVGVQTEAGPVDALLLANSWVFLGGLVMLRIEDLTAPIDVIYERLHAILNS